MVSRKYNTMEMENEKSQATRELTFGEKAVGIGFNPGKDPEVDQAKQIMANAIDQMNNLRETTDSQGVKRHASTAITMLEDAQMRMVKAITWKD